jgi:uncharacterized OsmC-like protein
MTPYQPGQIAVRHLDGDRFAIGVRGHTINVDQPVDAGGTDTAPTPTELFVASVAGCVAHYAHSYLARHDIGSDGLAVTARYVMAERPARVDAVDIHITPPDSLPVERRDAFLAVASHCTVHNSLAQPVAVQIELDAPVATIH